MGRGDSDLLYHPPTIVRAKRQILLQEEFTGLFLGRAEQVLLREGGQHLVFQELDGEEGRMLSSFLHQEESGETTSSTIQILDPTEIYSLNKRGLLLLQGENLLYFSPEGEIRRQMRVKPMGDGEEIKNIFLGKEAAYLVSRNSFCHKERSTLLHIPLDPQPKAEVQVSAPGIKMNNTGDTSVIFFSAPTPPFALESEVVSALTLREDAGEIISWGGEDGLSLGRESGHLFSPGTKDGTYFHFDLKERELLFLDLAAKERKIIASLPNKEIIDLAVFDDRVALLEQSGILLFDSSLIEEFAIGEHGKSKISFLGNEIIIWSEGSRGYTYFTIQQ